MSERQEAEHYSRWGKKREELLLRGTLADDLYNLGQVAAECGSIIDILEDSANAEWLEKFRYIKAGAILNSLERRKNGEEGLSVYRVWGGPKAEHVRKRYLFVYDAKENGGEKIKTFAPYAQMIALCGSHGYFEELMRPFSKEAEYVPEGYSLKCPSRGYKRRMLRLQKAAEV